VVPEGEDSPERVGAMTSARDIKVFVFAVFEALTILPTSWARSRER
jgi:hypothetical protein